MKTVMGYKFMALESRASATLGHGGSRVVANGLTSGSFSELLTRK